MNPPGTVLQVVANRGHVGGGEVSMLHSIEALTRMGVPTEALLLTPGNPQETAVWKRFLWEGIPFGAASMAGKGDLRGYVALLRLLGSGRFSLVHTHGERALLAMGVAGRASPLPWVHTVHGWVKEGRRSTIHLAHRLLSRVDKVVGVSLPLHRQLAAEFPGAAVHLSNAAPPFPSPEGRQRFRLGWGIEEGIPLVGWVGRLQAEKDPLGFFTVMNRVRRSRPEAQGVQVGDGDLAGACRERGRGGEGMRLEGGGVDGAMRMGAFDVLVLTSRTEEDPLVILEALVAGTPVVAPRLGGIPEMVEEGVTGLLYHPMDLEEAALRVVEALYLPRIPKEKAAAMLEEAGRDGLTHGQRLLRVYDEACSAFNLRRRLPFV